MANSRRASVVAIVLAGVQAACAGPASVPAGGDEPAPTFESIPVLEGYRTTWIGNTFGQGNRRTGNWVQNQVFALCVLDDGTVYANSAWDEAGREIGIYKDGKTVGNMADTHEVLGGFAIATDGEYVYAGMKSGFVRRYGLDGKPAAFPGGKRKGSDLSVGGAVPGPCGLAVRGEELYVSINSPDHVAVYSTRSFRKLRSWEVARCGALAIDTRGRVWVARRAHGQADPADVLCFDASGKLLEPRIYDVVQPSALAMDNKGRLMVAENGPDQQIRIYDLSRAAPKLTGTFGVKGGVFAPPRGQMGDDRFYGITALAMDAAGNLYVNCNGWTWSGTDLRCFDPEGKTKWRLQAAFFVDQVDADRADPTHVYGAQEHIVVDYDAPAGRGWRQVDYTLDPFRYPNDPRATGIGRPTIIRTMRIGGKLFLTGANMVGSHKWIFRFDGRIAVPAVCFAYASGGKGDLPGQPGGHQWLWRDLNGDGDFQAEEYRSVQSKRDGIAGVFDARGGYWQALWSEKVRYWPCQGLDERGIPMYDAQPAKVWPCPEDFNDMERLEYDVEADTLYISGYTPDWPRKDNYFIPAGRAVAAYTGWMKGNREPEWIVQLPYVAKPHRIAKAICFAGGYLFVNYFGCETILVIDRNAGRIIGRFVPGEEIASTHGDADMPWAINAVKLADGRYAVYVEDDRYAKQVLYLWKPPPAPPSQPAR